MSSLVVNGLRKQFGNTLVLDGVGFTLGDGECVALLGPSGCGKTTTLRCIGGLQTSDGGTIELNGVTLNGPDKWVPPQRREMGMVFQSYSVWPHLTVFDNVAFGLRLRRLKSADITSRVKRMLELMMIDHLANRRSWQLSGGQLQRVALARTLVVEPKLVLFDEPLSNLDAQLRIHMRAEIRSLLKKIGMSSVYVTHDQLDASVVADRTAIMNKGRIEQIGPWIDLYRSPATRFAAEFLSAESLALGTVLGLDNDRTIVSLASGGAKISVPNAGITYRVGDTVDLYIPREAISLRPGGSGQWFGHIEKVTPGPGVVEVTVRFDSIVSLAALVPLTDDPPEEGSRCAVDFNDRFVRIIGEPVKGHAT